jgi:ADP-heptose:LPS heptosyltransferase
MSEALFLQLCRLGDCVQSTVLIASWRERHPDDRITVLALPAFAPVFEGNEDVDEILLYEPSLDFLSNPSSRTPENLAAVRSWLEPLQRRRFRAVVNLTHNPFSGWIMEALKPEVVRGLSSDASGKILAKDPWSMYMLSLLKYRRLNLLNLADVFARLSGGAAVRSTPRFTVDRGSRDLVSQWLGQTTHGQCLIGFQPGASKAERRWPPENFMQLGRGLRERHRARILLFGTKEEEGLASSIAAQIPEARCFAGRTSIPQLAALLERCKVLVTNDTGTMHLAAAVGTRIVALFESSAYFRETGPYGTGHRVIQSPQILDYGDRNAQELERLSRIPAGEVSCAVDAVLAELGGDRSQAVPAACAWHYRSEWAAGLVDYLPIRPVPLQKEDLCCRLQKEVWLATLDGRSPHPGRAAEEAITLLKKSYLEPCGFALEEALEQFTDEVREANAALRKLHDSAETTLEKIRRDPGYFVPEEKLARLTELENEVLRTAALMAVQPFVAYFETALAMVEGEDTRQYLQNYQRQVLFLAKQLRAFEAILKAAALVNRR